MRGCEQGVNCGGVVPLAERGVSSASGVSFALRSLLMVFRQSDVYERRSFVFASSTRSKVLFGAWYLSLLRRLFVCSDTHHFKARC